MKASESHGFMQVLENARLKEQKAQQRDILQSTPMTSEQLRKLPHEIKQSFKSHSFAAIRPEEIELFRYSEKCSYWVENRKGWRPATFIEYRQENSRMAFMPYKSLVVVEQKSGFSVDGGGSYASYISYCNQGHNPIQASLLRDPSVHIDRISGHQVVLEQSRHTRRKFVDHIFTATDTVSGVCEQITGLRSTNAIYGFNKGLHKGNPPKPGYKITVAAGWLVTIRGSATNGSGISLSWQGPSSGKTSIALPKADANDMIDWETSLDLAPGEYTFTAKNSSSTSTYKLKVIGIKTLQFGLFYDGTALNYFNDRECQTDTKEASNIGKLYELYPVRRSKGIGKEYVRGVGTYDIKTGRDESFCEAIKTKPWTQGIKEKIEQGLGLKIEERIDLGLKGLARFLDQYQGLLVDHKLECIIDVFGFSRGAATARIFINRLHELINTKDTTYWPSGTKIKPRFVGLLDTVGSIGIPGDEKNMDFNLNLKTFSAQKIYQLTAQHEQREYFPSTSIYEEGKKRILGFYEEAVPGCHLNLGGGTPKAHFAETTCLDKFSIDRDPKSDFVRRKGTEKLERRLIIAKQEYGHWEGDISVKKGRLNKDTNQLPIKIILTRHVQPTIEHIYLEKMHGWGVDFGLPFLPITYLDELPIPLRYNISDELRALYQGNRSGSKESTKLLMGKYIHISHEPMAGLFSPDKPENRDKPSKGGKRRDQFFNKPDKAIQSW